MLPCQKHLFSLPANAHYLNCAYMSPVSKAVEEAGIAGIRAKRAPAAIGANDFFETTASVKHIFADLVHAPTSSISIVPSASYGMATVARNLPLETGQEIILAGEQFPSNVYPWIRLAGETGATVRFISAPEDGKSRGRRWNEHILESISTKTGLVAMGNVHWADGTLFDLEAIGTRCREVGAAFVIDGTQSVGALPFDVEKIKPDALVCAGYKWLLGPYSIGLAYYGPKFAGGMPLEENWITREGSENFGGLVQYRDAYQPGADRYDVGEKSNFILLPMLQQALLHLQNWQIPEIQKYCSALTSNLCSEVQELGFMLEEENWRAAHLFGVRVRKDIPMERLTSAISEANISVSIRGTAVRISPNVYNDETDISALREVFRSVAQNKTGTTTVGASS